MKTAVKALLALAAVFFGHAASAVTGNVYCWSSGSIKQCSTGGENGEVIAVAVWTAVGSTISSSVWFGDSVSVGSGGASCDNATKHAGASTGSMWTAGWDIYNASYITPESETVYSGKIMHKGVPPGAACTGTVSNGIHEASITRSTETAECTHGVATDGFCAGPPEVDCSKEAGKTIYGAMAAPGAAGCFGVIQPANPDEPFSNTNQVSGKCAAVIDAGAVTVSAVGASSGPRYLALYKFSGAECAAAEPPVVPAPAKPDEYQDTACVTGASGTVACIAKDMPKNCGTFNGEVICVDDVPAGNCIFGVGAGNWACADEATTPPKPPVSPELTATGRGSNGKPQTVQVFPPGAEGGDENSKVTTPGRGGTGTTDGGGDCGGPDQPPCKIDEEGTPTVDEGEFSDSDGSGAMDAAIAAAGAGEGSGQASEGQTGGTRGAISGMLPAPSDCGPIPWTFKGYTVQLDGYTRCAPIREGLSWLFGISASLYILSLIFRAPSP